MRRSLIMMGAITVALLAGLVAIPAATAGAASPSGLWVSNVATLASAPGTSCTHPGYSTIQSAVDAAASGAAIHVCAGTYVEQLNISKSVSLTAKGSVTVKLPATPQNSTTACDTEIGTPYQPNQDAVSICGANVSITGITVSAYWPAGTCYDSLYGIFVGAGGNLAAKKVAVEGAGVPLGDSAVGCQGGVGIEVGSARVNEAATATLTSTTVSGYQKNGITAAGTGTTLAIKSAAILGRGPIGTAENGIQISYGAKGTISNATISGNECVLPGVCGPDGLNDTQATGVLFYGAAPGSSLKSSTISGNDLGVYYASAAASEPGSAEVTISADSFTNNPDEAVVLDQGKAAVTGSVIGGSGGVGIEVLQYAGQTYAPLPTATKDNISGQQVGVKVASDQDVTDLPGTFKITNSYFLTSNTLAVSNNSANYTVYQSGNS